MRLDTDRLAALIVGTVKSAVSGFAEQISTLEKRLDAIGQPKDGEPGPQGQKGDTGARGETGPQGERGEVGPQGPEGPQGPSGPPGPAGEKGLDGAAGRDGRDGQPGLPGANGEKGIDGKDGRDGIDGKDGADGIGFDDISVEHDGERGFTFKFVRGERVKEFGKFVIPVMIHRGLWNAEKSYDYQDVTTFGGSQWICVDPTKKGKPGVGGPEATGWMLVVKEGRPGKEGQRGPEGPMGKQGPQGVRGPSGY